MSDLTVAKTILEQLGGNKFIVMTGSKNFIGDNKSLTMSLARNASSANRLKITLTSMDDYNMEFYRFTGSRFNSKTMTFSEPKHKTIKEYKGVFCDQLQELFTEVTGMYTRLF